MGYSMRRDTDGHDAVWLTPDHRRSSQGMQTSGTPQAPLLMRARGLTRREREVARLVIDGLSTEDMAAALFISVNTIRDHLKAIFGKVGVTLPGQGRVNSAAPPLDATNLQLMGQPG
jgi:DNA-binding CsgD family transcriptional regulator